MATVAEVKLWGSTIGAISQEEGATHASFQYTPDFVGSGIQVAPLVMPLSEQVYTFPELEWRSFRGLPGLLADSLPDKFGNAVINAWLKTEGRSPESFSPIERLCYTGTRGMGALEFFPVKGPRQSVAHKIQIDGLVKLANEILAQREEMKVRFDEAGIKDILQVGTSAGGARAKAVIAWNPKMNEVRSGQVPQDTGFEYWLIKFDGVSGNRDKESNDPKGYGVIEYAYSLMAKKAGIIMSDCRLLEEKGRRHFMTRRFDRLPNGEKLHMQSLCAMAHLDFNMAGAHSYEQAIAVMKQLRLPQSDIEQQYRRTLFNIVARNQDDHTKNIAFLMDKTGEWRLAPAFDVTYSYNPGGDWTSRHQMSLNGKRDEFSKDDFLAFGKFASIKKSQAESILEEVISTVKQWPSFAEKAKLSESLQTKIKRVLRLDFPNS